MTKHIKPMHQFKNIEQLDKVIDKILIGTSEYNPKNTKVFSYLKELDRCKFWQVFRKRRFRRLINN